MAKRTARAGRARARLSHVEHGPDGARARMVDVGKKRPERRSALARALVRFPPGLRDVAWSGRGPKGPLEEVARCAGLLAAKRTADLIPMCHPLALDHLEIVVEPREQDLLEVRCRALSTGKTGVEMEALTGAAVAALTIYDMTKALDKGIAIERLELLEKTGGKSGGWRAARS
jgi:cyclic pyranopterin phosphate synthase